MRKFRQDSPEKSPQIQSCFPTYRTICPDFINFAKDKKILTISRKMWQDPLKAGQVLEIILPL